MPRLRPCKTSFILHGLWKNDSGSIAILFAVSLTAIALAIGAGFDMGRGFVSARTMQSATDAAALAAASLDGNASESQQTAMALSIFGVNYTSGFTEKPAVAVTFGNETVSVTADTTMPRTLSGIIDNTPIALSKSATAWRGPRDPICVLALAPSGAGAFNIRGQAELSLQNCAGQSNSDDASSLYQQGGSSASADSFCSYGGFAGSNFTPKPYENCRKAEDPYEGLPVPSSYSCDYISKTYIKGSHVVTPGTFCKGMTIEAHANVTFQSGTYIIKGGEFRIAAGSKVYGNGVTFYLIGNNTKVTMVSGADVTLKAPTSGTYEGILFAQDPASNPGDINKIEGGANTTLVGALYFPTQTLNVSSTSTFGASSPYMPLVAWKLDFSGSAMTVIKHDRDAANMGGNYSMPTTRPSARLTN